MTAWRGFDGVIDASIAHLAPEPEAVECLGCGCPVQGEDELCRECEEAAEEAERIAAEEERAEDHRTSDDYWRQHAGRE